jgi:hypothetical protein
MCHPERSAAESKDLHLLELATLPNWSNNVANFRLTTLQFWDAVVVPDTTARLQNA